ncbi:MAG TPA: hypothetical protein VN918_03570 [Myxococcaceae bacterium]|nr:hypothetical protein [Myxococcaceae bacterium]
MEESARTSQLDAIRSFCAQQPVAVLFDEPGESLMDVFSGKTVPIALKSLVSVQRRARKGTDAPYLVLTYDDGREMALADVGIAFAPDLSNTGALDEIPAVVCFRDYATLLGRLKHELFGHSDRELTQATTALLMTCLAILDGARRMGFEVGREERELEPCLGELEKRATGPPRSP